MWLVALVVVYKNPLFLVKAEHNGNDFDNTMKIRRAQGVKWNSSNFTHRLHAVYTKRKIVTHTFRLNDLIVHNN